MYDVLCFFLWFSFRRFYLFRLEEEGYSRLVVNA